MNLRRLSGDILAFVLFKIAVDLLYVFCSSVQYAYLGSVLEFHALKYVVGWLAYGVFVFLILRVKDDALRFMTQILFVLSGCSNLSLYGLRNFADRHFLLVLVYWFLLIGLTTLADRFLKRKSTRRSVNSGAVVRNTLLNALALIAGVVLTVFLTWKFRSTAPAEGYALRSAFREMNIPTIYSYLLSWTAIVILPWLFLVSLNLKKWITGALVLALAFFMYRINAMKTWILVYPAIAVLFFLVKRVGLRKAVRWVLYLVSAAIAASILLYRFAGIGLFSGLLDRILVLPGAINYYYLMFFENGDKLYLSESILDTFLRSPYTEALSSILVSKTYMTAAYYHNATNGLLGDAYANFGLIGVFAYPAVIAFTNLIIRNRAVAAGKGVFPSVLFILMWLLVNTSYFTWLMTGGVFLYLAILIAYTALPWRTGPLKRALLWADGKQAALAHRIRDVLDKKRSL
jgi:hypothetical protein